MIEKIEGLSLVDMSFAPRDSPKPVFFWALSPPSTSHGVNMIANIHSLIKYCERYSWGREFVFFT